MKKMDKRILVAFSETFLYSPLVFLSRIERSKKATNVVKLVRKKNTGRMLNNTGQVGNYI